MIPPDIRPQPMPPQPMGPMMAQMGAQAPVAAMVDPIGLLEGKVGELEMLTGDLLALVNRVHPPLKAFLPVIAQAGMAMKQELGKLRERSASLSPPIPQEMAPPPGAGLPPAAV